MIWCVRASTQSHTFVFLWLHVAKARRNMDISQLKYKCLTSTNSVIPFSCNLYFDPVGRPAIPGSDGKSKLTAT